MGKEIEIQVRVGNVQPLLQLLEKEGSFQYDSRQLDEYYTPPHRDFISVRPIKEWLRLRDAEGSYSITYKNWHYDENGKSNYCDEYETSIDNIEQIRRMYGAIDFKKIITVDKQRKAWQYKDWEVSIDAIKDLGDFVEIEYKGSGEPDPKQVTDEMAQFLKSTGCGKIERNYLGYPFQLLFPDEVEWEEV